jgi:hypothetical protein
MTAPNRHDVFAKILEEFHSQSDESKQVVWMKGEEV